MYDGSGAEGSGYQLVLDGNYRPDRIKDPNVVSTNRNKDTSVVITNRNKDPNVVSVKLET